MQPRSGLTLLLAIAVAVSVAPALTDASSHYRVSVSPAIDTPDWTETFQGSTYDVTQLGRVEGTESIGASVVVGDGTEYDVLLYNSDRLVEQRDDGVGDGSVSFDATDLEPGSYVVALQVDNVIEDIEPVVVSQYHVSIDAPSSATEGSTVTVEATLSEVEVADGHEKALHGVQVVVGDGDRNVRASLDHDSGQTYSSSVDVGSLPAGEYSLYVVAQGTETIYNDRKELLGASDPSTFEIAAESSGDGDPSNGGGEGGGGGGTGAGTTATGTSAGTATEDLTTVTAPPTSTVTDGGAVTSVATGGDGQTSTASPTTDGSVITPNAPTTEPSVTTSSGQPLGVLPPLLALLAVVVLARRRR